ncbi:hypothetical protein HK100_012609 [Physocladia obscura]|uniref:Beta-lactamase-related domain-containing protein n=1 Tax=Physocladia obscura TaxID=109957 RepID=A0AAD5XFR9_9FUNG|nr:hypothetical protein HK100_012609 [Physocladia obscura]
MKLTDQHHRIPIKIHTVLTITLTALAIASIFWRIFVLTLSVRNDFDESKSNWDRLSTEIDAIRIQWNVPGVAVGVVRAGNLVYSSGFGIRNSKQEAVTPQTLFQVGSTTKAFTSFATATLVDEGKFEWDTPISVLNPKIKFYDPITTIEANFIDIMSHRTGLPFHNQLQWIWPSFDDINERLQYIQPSAQLRAKFQYSNNMFNLAGILAANISSYETWEKLVTERILKPLGMTNSIVDPKAMKESSNHSKGFRNIGGKAVEYEHYNQTYRCNGPRPAGSIISSVEDLSKWVAVFNRRGALKNGTQLISKKQFNMVVTPHTSLGKPIIPNNPVQFEYYGLGWFLDSYRGTPRIHHSGSTLGYSAQLTTFPDHDMAIIVLTNMDSSKAAITISNTISDRLLFSSINFDWAKFYKMQMAELEESKRKLRQKIIDSKTPGTQPRHNFVRYSGSFTNLGYGTILLKPHDESSKLFNFWWNNYVNNPAFLFGTIGHWEYDSWGIFEIPEIAVRDFEAPYWKLEFINGGCDVFVIDFAEDGVDPPIIKVM